jgi:hypothetical protein
MRASAIGRVCNSKRGACQSAVATLNATRGGRKPKLPCQEMRSVKRRRKATGKESNQEAAESDHEINRGTGICAPPAMGGCRMFAMKQACGGVERGRRRLDRGRGLHDARQSGNERPDRLAAAARRNSCTRRPAKFRRIAAIVRFGALATGDVVVVRVNATASVLVVAARAGGCRRAVLVARSMLVTRATAMAA